MCTLYIYRIYIVRKKVSDQSIGMKLQQTSMVIRDGSYKKRKKDGGIKRAKKKNI